MSTTNPKANSSVDASRIAARYIAAWNEQDAERRRALVSEVFASEATYLDPMARSAGRDEINAMIGAVQQQFAGLRFSLHGQQDGHNNVVRFSWALGQEGAEPVAHGTDVAVVSEDGRLAGVTGFLDAIAAPA
ncbi:MAG: nuclear transport factor 2 family protein [Rhodoferax sp.]|nr:nuclear transport factor 2 family protein [Rhodoferax sp.]